MAAAFRVSSQAASRRAAISASGNCTPWKRAIGPPNAIRWPAYSTAVSRAARAMPQAWAAMMMRPASSVERATFMPSPSTPSRVSAPISKPSNASSTVEEVWRPSFGISRPTVKPSPGPTRKHETPLGPSPPVRAKRMKTSAMPPLVIHCLLPLTDQPPPSRGRAAVRSAPASEPWSGSVSA